MIRNKIDFTIKEDNTKKDPRLKEFEGQTQRHILNYHELIQTEIKTFGNYLKVWETSDHQGTLILGTPKEMLPILKDLAEFGEKSAKELYLVWPEVYPPPMVKVGNRGDSYIESTSMTFVLELLKQLQKAFKTINGLISFLISKRDNPLEYNANKIKCDASKIKIELDYIYFEARKLYALKYNKYANYSNDQSTNIDSQLFSTLKNINALHSILDNQNSGDKEQEEKEQEEQEYEQEYQPEYDEQEYDAQHQENDEQEYQQEYENEQEYDVQENQQEYNEQDQEYEEEYEEEYENEEQEETKENIVYSQQDQIVNNNSSIQQNGSYNQNSNLYNSSKSNFKAYFDDNNQTIYDYQEDQNNQDNEIDMLSLNTDELANLLNSNFKSDLTREYNQSILNNSLQSNIQQTDTTNNQNYVDNSDNNKNSSNINNINNNFENLEVFNQKEQEQEEEEENNSNINNNNISISEIISNSDIKVINVINDLTDLTNYLIEKIDSIYLKGTNASEIEYPIKSKDKLTLKTILREKESIKKLIEFENYNQNLRSQVENLQVSIIKKNKNTFNEVDELKSTIDNLSAQLASTNVKLNTTQKELRASQSTVKNLKDQNSQLSTSLFNSQEFNNKILKNWSDLQNEYKSLEAKFLEKINSDAFNKSL
ncbi:hypothetical protein CYY_005714 [Polysphondylium violaceum]|uniref:Uncharacterized protein n=1 Tax=Polysphondylium violaceum TaxID=133409 RepID=A0A8J4V6L5_9MYCE|nr:hypothetical protein CYY_005714 [Polysphondylium violaceum]